jgi:hypothetical protein
MFGGLRKNVKKIAGAAVGLTGLFIAASPALTAVSATTSSGTQLTQQTITLVPQNVASAYGVNPQTGQVDFGRLISTIVFPVLGGIIFIKGIRMVLKHV